MKGAIVDYKSGTKIEISQLIDQRSLSSFADTRHGVERTGCLAG